MVFAYCPHISLGIGDFSIIVNIATMKIVLTFLVIVGYADLATGGLTWHLNMTQFIARSYGFRFISDEDSYNRCNSMGTRLAGEIYETYEVRNLTEIYVDVDGDEEEVTIDCIGGMWKRTIDCENVLTSSGEYKMKFSLYDFFEDLDYVVGRCLEEIYEIDFFWDV